MLWNLANLGLSQYTTFIATINADNNQETVGSVANKLRNFESMIIGPMQAHVSAVVKELKEDFKEEMREIREEVKVQRVPIATSTVHHQQYQTNRDAVISIHKMIPAECRPQFAFTWRGMQYTWNHLPQGCKYSPTICHGLIQAALEKGEAPEHLQYIDDIIVWGNTAVEVFEKGEKIIRILLRAGFAIKKSKVKGPAQEIQFLGVKWQDGWFQIPTEVINKITTMSPPTSKKETQAFLGVIGFWRMHIPKYSQILSHLYLITRKKNDFHWGAEQASLCADQAGDHSCGSPWPSQNKTRSKICALFCSREPWLVLKLLAEGAWRDSRPTSGILEPKLQRVRNQLQSHREGDLGCL
ncbi:hypothetical protein TURU_005640 [Turdus rufiventris]|nr:hypothetical protein TURU_005640 [Turdus rufiventris]